MNTHRVTVRVEGEHAEAILEHIINPALRDFDCAVSWPDMADPEISVAFDPDEICEAINADAR